MKENLEEAMDELYSTQESVWGNRVDPAITERIGMLKDGSVLDLGAGDGNQSLYLAENGFEVTAVDISTIGLEVLKTKAKDRKLSDKITTFHSNISEFNSTSLFDNVISTYVLHFLRREDALKTLRSSADMTEKGGVHILMDFKTLKIPKNLWLQIEEIESLYQGMGWEVLENSETIRRMSQDPETEVPTYIFVAKKN